MWTLSSSVALDRGAAEPLGAVESSRGATNVWTWRIFTGNLLLGVPPNCSITKKEFRESKKVEKHLLLNPMAVYFNPMKVFTSIQKLL